MLRNCPGGSVRLVDGSGNPVSSNTGLLQMGVNSVWKYVCDDEFDDNSNGVNVACREMGFAFSGSQGDGTAHADLFYNEIQCTGTESHLIDCRRAEGENCSPSEAVTLTCDSTSGMCSKFCKEIMFCMILSLLC